MRDIGMSGNLKAQNQSKFCKHTDQGQSQGKAGSIPFANANSKQQVPCSRQVGRKQGEEEAEEAARTGGEIGSCDVLWDDGISSSW